MNFFGWQNKNLFELVVWLASFFGIPGLVGPSPFFSRALAGIWCVLLIEHYLTVY